MTLTGPPPLTLFPDARGRNRKDAAQPRAHQVGGTAEAAGGEAANRGHVAGRQDQEDSGPIKGACKLRLGRDLRKQKKIFEFSFFHSEYLHRQGRAKQRGLVVTKWSFLHRGTCVIIIILPSNLLLRITGGVH